MRRILPRRVQKELHRLVAQCGSDEQTLKLFTISVGTEDFLYEPVKQNIAMFQKKNLKVEPLIVPGGHTWMNCKAIFSNYFARDIQIILALWKYHTV
jgi:citrate lyase synthetase